MTFSHAGPVCSTARQEILRFLHPEEADLKKRFVPRDKLFAYLKSGKPPIARQILECQCQTCAGQRMYLGPPGSMDRIDGYLKRIYGNEDTIPQFHTSALSLFSLFVAIGYPVLICTLFHHEYTDCSLQPGHTSRFLAGLKGSWPQMALSEFEMTVCPLLEHHLRVFAIPHLQGDSYTTYDPNTVLPFINEQQLGRRLDDGTIVSEGAYSRVYSFEIYSCYNKLDVSVFLSLFSVYHKS